MSQLCHDHCNSSAKMYVRVLKDLHSELRFILYLLCVSVYLLFIQIRSNKHSRILVCFVLFINRDSKMMLRKYGHQIRVRLFAHGVFQ